MTDMPIDIFDAYHYAANIANNTESRLGTSVGTGGELNRRLQLLLLREDRSVNDYTQNTPIYSKKKPLNWYHGGYTYD